MEIAHAKLLAASGIVSRDHVDLRMSAEGATARASCRHDYIRGQAGDGRLNITMILDKTGHFVARTADGKGLPPGKYTVCVTPAPIDYPPGPPPPAALNPPNNPNIPAQYRTADKSPFQVVVDVKTSEIKLNMEAPKDDHSHNNQ